MGHPRLALKGQKIGVAVPAQVQHLATQGEGALKMVGCGRGAVPGDGAVGLLQTLAQQFALALKVQPVNRQALLTVLVDQGLGVQDRHLCILTGQRRSALGHRSERREIGLRAVAVQPIEEVGIPLAAGQIRHNVLSGAVLVTFVVNDALVIQPEIGAQQFEFGQ